MGFNSGFKGLTAVSEKTLFSDQRYCFEFRRLHFVKYNLGNGYTDRVFHRHEPYRSGFAGALLCTPHTTLVNTICHNYPFDFVGIPDLVANQWSLSSQLFVHN